MSRSSPSGKGHSRMAEPRFNNPYFWPPPPTMPSQLDNLVLINKIKEQLMAEKIRPPHLPPTSASSQQPLLVPPAPAESSQAVMSLPKLQQVPGLHPQAVPQPDVALHARPATSTVTGLGLSSRTPAVSTSESSAGTGTGTSTPSTPTTTSQSRLIASSPTLISGITSPPLLDSIKTIQGHGLLGPPKSERGRKKIKAENPGGPPVLVVPYPILASGETAKEGKTYRCKVCPLTFFTKSEMQIHSKSHTEAKPHKCPHCSKSFANASYLAQHLRIHLGVKPYHCSYCDKSFRQLSHLQQHTRDFPSPGCPLQNPHRRQTLQVPTSWLRKGFHSALQPPVSPAPAQQGQALQVSQLLPGLLRLRLPADPPLSPRHQARQGLLLQHVWAGLHLGDLPDEAHVQTHGGGAPGEPSLAPEDGVPRHPGANLSHLSPREAPPRPAHWQTDPGSTGPDSLQGPSWNRRAPHDLPNLPERLVRRSPAWSSSGAARPTARFWTVLVASKDDLRAL
nr:zinc finger protein 362 isoform X2 [Microcebus murinus]XP_012620799.1 zinc finger protein 362 isoform X2 [Microcebus murinus]